VTLEMVVLRNRNSARKVMLTLRDPHSSDRDHKNLKVW
jgi:hypothetical protein